MAQWISLPLTVSCFSKIQIGFAFLVPAHPGSPGQRAVKRGVPSTALTMLFLQQKACKAPDPGSLVEDIA